MNILFFGDVVGKPGRNALTALVPELRSQYSADLVIANVENIAHGFGITPDTVGELRDAGVDLFTSGNHVWKNHKGVELLESNPDDVLCPVNFAEELPGNGFVTRTVDDVPVLVINLQGQVFFDEDIDSPFLAFDKIYEEFGQDAITIVDLHAEATGEKRIFGWHVDGRASLVVGTHTHIQTADEQILPQGTAYITDTGMVGAVDSSLGMNKELVAQKVVQRMDVSLEPPVEPEEVFATGVFVSIDNKTKQAMQIERFDHRTSISYTKVS